MNITRCSNNYGPYQFPEKLIPLMINNTLQHKELPIYGDGMQIRDWLYVMDHCKAIDMVANGGKILLLTYTGGSAGEPLVVALYERFKVRANIVFGNIDFIQGAALGKLGVVLTGEKESVIQAEEYLKQNGVYVEELKNGLH